MKTVLLHICCGPCAIYPVDALREEGFCVKGLFYNPNIHPFSEYARRTEAVEVVSGKMGFEVIYCHYDFESFLRVLSQLKTRENRHAFCWKARLKELARAAKKEEIVHCTTTLLSSPYQDIEQIKRYGKEAAEAQGVTFLDRKFRQGFAESHKTSKSWGLYHQTYCGCCYSEKEAKVKIK